MSVLISCTIEGEEQMLQALNMVGASVSDMRPLAPGVAKALRSHGRRMFSTEGAEGELTAGGWPALAPSTVARKARHYRSRKILVRTGRLRGSVTGETADSIVTATPEYIEVGTAVPYARFHQRGTRHMPQRRIYDLSERTRVGIVKVFQRHIVEALRAAGKPPAHSSAPRYGGD